MSFFVCFLVLFMGFFALGLVGVLGCWFSLDLCEK